jgi:hypothetical protein
MDANGGNMFSNTTSRPGLTEHRRQLLKRLASNTRNPAVAEMARDLLNGRITPRDVMANGLYNEELSKGTEKFTSWYRELSDEEKTAAWEQAEAQFDELAKDSPSEHLDRRAANRRRSTPDDDLDYSEQSWME